MEGGSRTETKLIHLRVMWFYIHFCAYTACLHVCMLLCLLSSAGYYSSIFLIWTLCQIHKSWFVSQPDLLISVIGNPLPTGYSTVMKEEWDSFSPPPPLTYVPYTWSNLTASSCTDSLRASPLSTPHPYWSVITEYRKCSFESPVWLVETINPLYVFLR